ncbi:MAG: serine hydrolase domain-containing protein [Parcubacteria group bacterium]
MESKIREKIQEAISAHVFPGCVIGIVKKNGERLIIPSGNFTYDPKSSPVTETSIFDVASITKVIPTSSLALKLIDEKRLNLDDQLIKFVPEFHNSERDNVLIWHLLTHTLDFSFRLSEHKEKTPDEILKIIFTSEFKNKPGKIFFYSNATSILLGLVVERILGKPLDELGKEYLFDPLKMNRTLFNPLKEFKREEIVPTEIQEWRSGHASASDKRDGLVQGEAHDESAYILNQKMVVGSAGLFSCCPDLLNFMEMILSNGTFDGKKYFSPEMVNQMQTNQLSDIGKHAGLGWELNQPRYMGVKSENRFGKTGFTGSLCIYDMNLKIAVVILSNRVYPKRKHNLDADINKFRRNIANIVFGS